MTERAVPSQIVAPFQLVAGHPALDFVNTLDKRPTAGGPQDILGCYEDLLCFALHAGVLTAEEMQSRMNVSRRTGGSVLEMARSTRETIGDAFHMVVDARSPVPVEPKGFGPQDMQIKALDSLLKLMSQFRALEWDPESKRPQWRWTGEESQLPVYRLVKAAEDLLFSPGVAMVRSCESPTCQWLFLDGSRNHRRRWCDMKICGNRMKARVLRARRVVSPPN